MTTKTSAWTDEERAEMAKRRAQDYRGAWERDTKGHVVMAPTHLSSHCLLQRHGEACEDRYGVGGCSCDCHRPYPHRVWEGHICPEYEHCSLCVAEAADCAAAIVGGFIGMGLAIRDRNACATCGANMLGEGGPCYSCVRCA